MNPDIRAHMQAYIKPLNMNGLEGRMLQIKSKKKRNKEILFIYGHHASLERMFGLAEVLSDYGNVTMPDLPGFGGMDSYRKIGIRPSLDSMADYLATFMRLKYKGKKVTIIGMSLGFVIVTRMLQKYPELTKQIKLNVSIAGFSHKHDMVFSRSRRLGYLTLVKIFSTRLPAIIFYNFVLHPSLIRLVYARTHNAKNKFADLDADSHREATEFEIELWRSNDVATYMKMAREMLTLDNCRKQINIPVHNVTVGGDQYLDSEVVEQHLRVVYSDYFEHMIKSKKHAPSILARKSEAQPYIPSSLKKVLAK